MAEAERDFFIFNTYRGLLNFQKLEFVADQFYYREDGAQIVSGQETPWSYICDLEMTENKLRNIGLSPNPSTDFVALSGNDLSLVQELAIYDIHGKLVKKLTLSDIQSKISISELDNGVYLLSLNQNSKVLRF
ncbi:T9SS type A sorting domain-containing protein [Fluviicola taffensis]|uniref:Secretion system C-terminal sorting domain-containing protein n=1 Tax=Fluviicola taffensis (strain DSM 16823 / NCIMB 13979 / RW262) TaxID=755732 RepID=F2I9Z0_FLUTR|nr:T9SS type A sorting domain-containing protein [Fluviicola taffensis]AEA44148.1 hypothetical protein Fluta_2162 [Fluviicola taffensis DSM 16823]